MLQLILSPWSQDWREVCISVLSVATNREAQGMLGAMSRPNISCPLVITAQNAQRYSRIKLPLKIIWRELTRSLNCIDSLKIHSVLTVWSSSFAVDPEKLMTSLGGGKWECLSCGYQSSRTIVKNHIEAKHTGSSGYKCEICSKNVKNRVALNNHMSTAHRYWIKIDEYNFCSWCW